MNIRGVVQLTTAIYRCPVRGSERSPYRTPYRVAVVLSTAMLWPIFTYAFAIVTQSPGQALGFAVAMACVLAILLLRSDLQTICTMRVLGGHLNGLSSEERHILLRMLLRSDRLGVLLITKSAIIATEDIIDDSMPAEKRKSL